MLVQNQPEQPAQDSGAPSLHDRIESAFTGKPTRQRPQQEPPQQQEQQEVTQETEQEPVAEVEAEAPAEGDQGAPPEMFELEFDGEKFTLPKKLEKGFMQERDYTQKSQGLADQRRSIELKEQQFRTRELQDKFNTDVANDVRQMQMIDAVLEQPVNWNGMSTDDAFRHKIQLDDLSRQREKLAQSVQQRWQQFQQQQQAAQAELSRKTLEAVRSRIPNWNDAAAKEVTDHFRDRGLTDADFALFNQNPEFVQAAWEAMQYRKLQARAKPAVEQAKTVKATGAKPMPPATKDYLNYRKALSKTKEGSPERRKVVEGRIASIFSR